MTPKLLRGIPQLHLLVVCIQSILSNDHAAASVVETGRLHLTIPVSVQSTKPSYKLTEPARWRRFR